ncbi:MAG: antitoxin family protein [Acidobacteria bacterium]|nr:antitoxin family protein [Acidobacteriota bacterium]MBI3427345.1 antitoxin family protein [Acidobacteriota bacterium]
MTTTMEAVFEQGVLRPLKPLDWAEGTRVELTVVTAMPARQPYEILSAIAALPLEVTREEHAGRDHDGFLYGGLYGGQEGEEQP